MPVNLFSSLLNSALLQSKINLAVNGSSAVPSASDAMASVRNAILAPLAVTGVTPELKTVGNVASAQLVSRLSDRSSIVDNGPAVTYPSDAGTSVTVPDYLNADLAKAYGMDASTAYQEALSNTSYQRAVADLRAAGLNPALLTGSFGPASSSVYGASLASDGLSTGVSSAAGAHDAYKSYSNIGSLLGAGIGFIAKGPSGAMLGSQIGAKVLGAFGNILDSSR